MAANVVNIALDEFDKMCAEILENWNSPSLGNSSIVHQNPFSQFNPPSYDDIIQSDTNDTHCPVQPLYYTTNVETKSEGLEHKEDKTMKRAGYEKEKDENEGLEHKEDKTMKTAGYEKEKDGNEGLEHKEDKTKKTAGYEKEEEDENEGLEHKEDKTMKTAGYEEEEGECLEHKEDKTMKTTGYEEEEEDDDSDDGEHNFRIILNQYDACDPPSQCNFVVNKPVPATSGSCSVAKFKFVTPFNKTIFDINIDHISEKLWRNPGVDTSDFFNYGLDEKKWKDYCKLIMRTKVKAGSASRQSAMNADKHRQSPKERDTDEVKVDRAKIDECLNLADAKDPKLYDLNVIIEIAIRDSASEKTPIKGEKILPFPMDSYSSEYLKFDAIKLDMAIDDCLNFADSEDLSLHDTDVIIEIVCEKAQPLSDSDNTPQHIKCRMIKGDKILPFPMNSYTSAKDRHKRPMWRKERDYYSSRQENRKRGKFNDAISHQKIEEDPEKLKRRRERFEVPLSTVKNGVVANKPNVLKRTTDPDIKDQRPTRTRKWRNN